MQNVSALVLCAALALPSVASAQLLVGNDQTNPGIWHVDVNTNTPTNLLAGATATAWGMAYNGNANTLYWNNGSALRSSPFSLAGLTPSNPVTITFNAATISITGLAYDTVRDRLVGYRSVTLPGFYEINPVSGVASLIAATPASTDFGGLDYDTATDTFIGLNDAVGGPGRGVIRISNMYTAPTYTSLGLYPGGDTDIDGLGVGGGFAWMVNDVPAQGINRFNLTTNSYGPLLPSPFTGTNGIFSSGAWVPAPSVAAVLAGAGLVGLRRRRGV